MKINGLHVLLLTLAPLFAGWNGAGKARLEWAPEAEAPGVELDADAVAVVHENIIEAVVILPVPGLTGDGVLTVQASTSLRNARGVDLPDISVRVRLREYGEDGTTLFRGLSVARGSFYLEGPATGPLRFSVDAILKDGLQTRRIKGHFEISPLEAVRDDYVDEETGEAAVIYHADTGCWGTWDEDDDPDEVDWEDEDSESGCGGDDLDDDGPSGSGGCDGDDPGGNSYDEADSASEGSCEGDTTEDYETDTADDTGCEGDNVDSSGDSGCACEGDDVDVAVGCARSGPRGPRSPWVGRLVGWLPWFTLFLFVAGLRFHARRGRRFRPAAA